jgi:hypothetical protein
MESRRPPALMGDTKSCQLEILNVHGKGKIYVHQFSKPGRLRMYKRENDVHSLVTYL